MNTTLIIDGNWLMMSRLFALEHLFKKDNDENIKEQGVEILQDMMAKSINITINRFGQNINNIILVCDGGSWRKQLQKPTLMSNIKYKGNRQAKVEYDWYYVYQALNRLQKHCEEIGITTSFDDNIEGDDWIWYWTRRLNEENINAIIWSSDNDLKQLVQIKNGIFTAWYNNQSGLFLPHELGEAVGDIDFFMDFNYSNYVVDELKKCCLQVSYIRPEEIIMSKIMCGDNSDNIKPVLFDNSGKRTTNLTVKNWNAIREDLCILDLRDFFERSDEILSSVRDLRKFQGLCTSNQVLRESFEYNKKLVWLDESVIPESVTQRMSKSEYKKFDLSTIRSNYKILCDQEADIEEIFEGI